MFFQVVNQHTLSYPSFPTFPASEIIASLCPIPRLLQSRLEKFVYTNFGSRHPPHIMITHNTIEELGRSNNSCDMLQGNSEECQMGSGFLWKG